MRKLLELFPLVVHGLRRPFGPDDDDDDAAGDAGEDTRRRGENGDAADDDGGDDAPLTARSLNQILDRRLGPLEEEATRNRNRRHAEARRRTRSRDDREDDRSDNRGDDERGDGKKRSTAEKADDARERRIQRLEALEDERKKGDALDRVLRDFDDDLVPGAGEKIRRLLSGRMVVDRGEVFVEDGDDLVELREAVELEAKDPMFRKAKRRGGGKRRAGEADQGTGGEVPDRYEGVDFESMTDEEFDAWDKKEQERLRRRSGRR